MVRTIAVGVVLLGTSMGSAGLGLGRVQGAAWVGKPLDVQIQAQFDGNEDPQANCLEADVQYGDSLQDASRVTVRLVPTTERGSPGHAIRVTAAVLIDEPIVAVNVRVGCQQKLSKRYVLFADLPTSVVDPVVLPQLASTRAPVVAPVAPVSAAVRAELRPARPVPVPAPAAKAPVQRVAKARSESTAVAVTVPSLPPRVNKAVRPSAKARLKLDPLDLLTDYSPVLRASDELLTLPQEDSQKRAEAAALWRALNASPDDVQQEDARAQRLQSDLQALHALTAENQKGLVNLAAKAQKAESERYANGLVYGLIALWVICLMVLVWVWRRMRTRRSPNWADGLDAGEDSFMADYMPDPPAQRVVAPPEPLAAAPIHTAPAVQAAVAAPLTEVDFDLDLMESSESALMPVGAIYSPPVATAPPPAPSARDSKLSPAAARAAGHVDFQLSMSPGARAIDSEELMDARQQAEFFMSLGQHDKAIEILTTRIAQVGESSPLVCLDLLKIYHGLGRQAEFEFMRTEFNHWFAGRVPEFADFGNDGRSLERYPQIMQRIQALWPSPQVLEYIEGCIYQHSDEGDGVVFDLQAYLDLLFLHGVAKRIVRQTDADDDGGASELLRIPPRTHGAPVRQARDNAHGAAVAHRAGAHLRGARQRNPIEEPDPEEDVETRGAPLSPMRVPPSASLPDAATDRSAHEGADEKNGSLTDFNFLDLR